MEDSVDVYSDSAVKHSGDDDGCCDSLEQQILDDTKSSVDGNQISGQSDREKGNLNKVNKKVIKHALRQQAKRRRKNTTIAAGGGSSNVPIHRLSSSPLCELEEMTSDTSNYRQPTMAEVLSSIPGFHLRVPSRKRSNKKLSAAAQIEQTREGCVDLESPDSILVNTNLRQLLNRHTFASLPQLYQYKLLQLLPHVDRVPTQTDTMYRLSSSGLNNEFFARACLDWRERLSEGEFTPENQAKLKAEQEKEKSKLDPWKLKHFEPMWGESLREWPSLPPGSLTGGSTGVATSPLPTTPSSGNKKELSKGVTPGSAKVLKDKPVQPPIPVRTVGAVTRAVTSYREKKAAQESGTKVVNSISRAGKEVKEPKQEPKAESISDNVVPPKEKKKDKVVEKKCVATETFELEYIDKSDIIVDEEHDNYSLPIKPEENDVVDDKSYADDTIQNIEQDTSCETYTIILEEEEVKEEDTLFTVTPQLERVEETSPHTRKRKIPEVVATDVLKLEPHSSHPKRSKSAEKEPEVVMADADTDVVELPEDNSPLMMEVVPSDLVQLEVPEISREESPSSLVVEHHEEIESSCQTAEDDVDTAIQTEITEEVVDDLNDHCSEMDLKTVENTEIRPVEPSGSESAVVLEHMELVPNPEDLPISPINQGLEVGVETNPTESHCPTTDDQDDDEVDKTLGDVVALEQEVADRQSIQSVKAEALNKSAAHLEEWEIIKVDPNDGTTEVACSTACEVSIPTSVAALPSLSAYDEELKEDEAALLAAAWDVVGSSSEFQRQVNMNQPVSVIPCQEELEVRLQESPLPAPQWDYTPQDAKCQPQGHVKLELEVTLTPEVDSSTVTSTCTGSNGTKLQLIGQRGTASTSTIGQPNDNLDQSQTSSADIPVNPGVVTSYNVLSPKTATSCASPNSSGQASSIRSQQQLQVVVCSTEGPGVTVIPPTTIVCLPPPSVSNISSPHPPPLPHHHRSSTTTSSASQGPLTIAQSSPALPFIALTTSTPVRALVTKSVTKPSGRTGRNTSNVNRPPPGAVNLERSYQICQAVIQNSPNRHQLRCQLKPPPSSLTKSGVPNPTVNRTTSTSTTTAVNRAAARVGIVQQPQHANTSVPTSRSHVVFRHVFASSTGGIPVNMAVLPSVHHQVSEVMRGLELRRSNSAPPHSAEATRGVRPPSAPPLPPPFAASASPASSSGGGSSNCSCSLKAMIACVVCGAFCHDDCLASPTSRMCVMCCDTR